MALISKEFDSGSYVRFRPIADIRLTPNYQSQLSVNDIAATKIAAAA
jgi:hypothetical protein